MYVSVFNWNSPLSLSLQVQLFLAWFTKKKFMARTSIWAYHNENKHVLTLEGDKEIFYNVFKPLAYDHPNEGLDGKHDD